MAQDNSSESIQFVRFVLLNPFRFIHFENRYSSNLWYKGFFQIPPTNTDFQIVFEAMVAENRITDIAIDDVALLRGVDCTDGGTTTPEAETSSDEPGGIYNIQSCENRCAETEPVFTSGNETIFEDGQTIEKCDCHEDCLNLGSCCIDYQLICIEGKSLSINYKSIYFNQLITHKPKLKLGQASDPDSTTTTVYTSTEIETSTDIAQFRMTHNATLSSVQQPMTKKTISQTTVPPTPTIYIKGTTVHSHITSDPAESTFEQRNSKNRIPIRTHSKLMAAKNSRPHISAKCLIATGVVAACILLASVIGWRRCRAHKSKRNAVHQIFFAQSEFGSHVRFNSTHVLDNATTEESNDLESDNDSKSDNSNTKVNFLNKMNQRLRPSQLLSNQFDEKKCLLGDHEEGDSSL